MIDYIVQLLSNIYGLKILILIPVQVYYEYQKSLYMEQSRKSGQNLTDPSFDYRQEQLRRSISDSYKILVDYGVGFRDTGVYFALAAGLIIVAVPLAYYGSRWYKRKEMSYCCGIENFMQDYDDEMRRVRRRIDRCIQRTEASIRSHMKILTSNEKINSTNNANDSMIDHSNSRLVKRVEDMVKLADIGESIDNSPRDSIKSLIEAFYIRRQEVKKSINSLETAMCHLCELRFTGEKMVIWPTNRNLLWHRHLLGQWTKFTIMSMIGYFCLCHISQHVIIEYSFNKIKSNDFVDPSKRYPNWQDFFDILLIKLIIIVSMDWQTKPYAYLQVSFIDQLQYLGSLIDNFCNFNDKLRCINAIEDGQAQPFVEVCDLRLLDLYVSYQVFEREIKSMFKRAERSVVYLYCSLLLVITGTFIIIFSSVELWNVLGIICLVLALSLNLILVPMAILNQKCKYISKLVYHMIAHAEKFNNRIEGTLKLSSHTLNLWRKLIADPNSYSNNFSCNLSGFAQLNYGTIVRLNSYIISILILLISSHLH